MTNNKLLDAILHAYLHAEKLRLEKDPRYQRLTFMHVAKSLEPGIEKWHVEFLRKQLFDDGFLDNQKYISGEPYILTPSGIKAAQSSYYSSQADETLSEKKIREGTIISFGRAKVSIAISIAAIIIPTIISIYGLAVINSSPSADDYNELKLRIERIENSRDFEKPIESATKKDNDTTQYKFNER